MPQHSMIGIFGKDRRQAYLAAALSQQGYTVFTYEVTQLAAGEETALDSLAGLFAQCDVIVGPIPFAKEESAALLPEIKALLTANHLLFGGKIPPSLAEHCDRLHIPCVDLLQNERVAILNAIATAEGAIMQAIQSSVVNLHASRCLMLGYGRCARVLAQKLKGLDAAVTVAARSEQALAYAEAAGMQQLPFCELQNQLPTFDFIFNTVPALILDKSCLSLLKPGATVIDLASAPGGVDYLYAQQIGCNAKLCLGLPGLVAPQSSADILASELIQQLEMEM